MFLNKSSSTNELPSEASITLHDLRCITTRSRLALEPLFFDPQSQSQDLCPPRVCVATRVLHSTCFAPGRLLFGIYEHGTLAVRETRFETKGHRADRQPTLKSESGPHPLSGSRAGKRQVEIDVIRRRARVPIRSDETTKSENLSDYAAYLPRRVLKPGGSYTDNLKPAVRRRHEERFDTRKNYLRRLLRISV